ncbi:MAG: adenylate/guanylate cyclase domain-containing protein [Lacunisphaera sp.]|nr:adenylate/guanylate cyclase domain-containing protein [Lacunisphaera sp.]
MSRPFRNPLTQLWWAPLLCYGLAWLSSQTDTVKQFEWRTLDWRTQFRVGFQPPPDPRVVLVLFDDDTENNLVSWPPSRQYHANLIELMSLAGLKVATMDVFMTALREDGGDALMRAGVTAAQDRGTWVVTGAVTSEFEVLDEESKERGPTRPLRDVQGDLKQLLGEKHAVLPFPDLRAVSFYGFVDAPKEGADGIVRQPPLVVRIGDEVYPSLSLQTLMAYLGVAADAVRVRLGDAVYLPTKAKEFRIPIDARGCYLINFRYEAINAAAVFPTYGYRALLLGLHSKHVEKIPDIPEPPDLLGRIAVIGLFSTGNADAGPTPLGAYSPLPLVHANIINNVLAEDYVHPVSERWVWGLAVVLGWAGILVMAHRSVTMLCAGAVLGMAGWVAASFWGWVTASLWVPLVGPLLGFGALQFILIGRRAMEEHRGRQELKGMFGAYVSPQLVDRLVKAGTPPQLGGHVQEITAYFSDIQGFSSFSEVLPPERLVELMNEYLTACTDLVQEDGGTLDKYIGDAVVVMFGAPITLKDHAYRACVASQRVQRRLGELRAKWKAEGEKWPPIVRAMQTRIGLNTGSCVIGNMGSRTRFNYTMMGDDVNLAARMESGAKSWGVYSMCTEATRLACEQQGGDRVVFRPLGRIVVKGRAQAVPIHEIVGLKEWVSADTRAGLELFGAGLERYYARDWDGAAQLFHRSAALEANIPEQTPGVTSNPSLVYGEIVARYKNQPPDDNWTGVYVMKEK